MYLFLGFILLTKSWVFIMATMQKVIISEQLEHELSEAITPCKADRIFILTDETTQQLCMLVEK